MELKMKSFTKSIACDVEIELAQAKDLAGKGHNSLAFQHLENAHVLGQESTWWHVKVHILMLKWGIAQRDFKECLGQLLRIVGAATKTAIGLVPVGNTGGSNISPFKSMPLKPEHQAAIQKAKGQV